VTAEALALHGRRILIAEDGFALASVLETALSTLGCLVVGPVARIDEGLALATRGPLDGALLDVSLCGEEAYALADALLERSVPVILVTGRMRYELPERYRGLPMMPKPFDMPSLVRLCNRTFAAGSASGAGEQAIQEQNEHRAEDGGEKSDPVAIAIPAELAPRPARDQRARNPQQRGHHEA